MKVFGSEHELKLLNLTVILYLIAGALVFHWLGEFEGPASWSPAGAPAQQTSQSSATSQKHANDKRPRLELAHLRLASVRRMWNITNQLNILYEANWTELVLAELVEFERQFVESLESLAARDSLALELEDSEVEWGETELEESDKNENKDKTKKAQEQRAASRKRHLDEQRRMKSIKRALVHSLATITTMGSPVQAPRSQLGRLLTILYGALGIPLLVVTVAKSGHRLADASLNGLLILRHYCVSMPLHFLCCSCNLFVCLRWLGWCCCCCCCSYLCCLSTDSKQKCCDYANAPKLTLVHGSGRKGLGQRRGRGRTRLRLNKIDQQRAAPQAPEGGSSFVIGFNLNNHAQLAGSGAGGEQQKSVRFVDDKGEAICAEQGDEQEDSGRDMGELELSREQSSSLLLTSCSILALYLALGAYYHSNEPDGLPFVDALFACYAMLATSTLPDSFHLDRPATNPLGWYKSHHLGNHNHLPSPPLASNFTGGQLSHNPSPSRPRFAFGQEVKLTIDSLYLLIGLNLISACAQFARLWLNGVAQERLSEKCASGPQPADVQANRSHCNGGPPSEITSSTSLMVGSFEHQNPNAANQSALVASCPPLVASYEHNNFHNHNHHHHHHQLEAPALPPPVIMNRNVSHEQINLAELFVMGGGGVEQLVEAVDQPGASFASSSASSQARSNASLCARHQSTAVHALASPHTSETSGHLHLAPDAGHQTTLCSGGSLARRPPAHANHHHQQHRRQASHLELDQMDLINKLKPSSSSFQLAGEQQQNQFGTIRPNQQNYQPTTTNGFGTTGGGQHSVEPDSSPNTFDTNSQTMSSMSSRANTMMIGPVTGAPRPSGGTGERTISWYGQVDSSAQ